MSDPEVSPLTNGAGTSGTSTTNDPTATMTINLNKNIIISIFKIIVGSLLIGLSADASWYYTVGGYMILIFLGIYLILDVLMVLALGMPVQIVVNGGQTLSMPPLNRMRLYTIALLSLILVIVEFNVGPGWWPTGNIIGLILAIIVLLVSLSLITGKKILPVQIERSGTSGSSGYASLSSSGSNFVSDMMSYVVKGLPGFTPAELYKKRIEESRVMYYLAISIVLVLVTLVAAEEFILITNWDCKDLYARNWIPGALGIWNAIGCDVEYFAGTSALCTLIVLSLVIPCICRPTLMGVMAGLITFGYGIYMALLSTHTVQSLLYMGNFSASTTNATINPELLFDPTTNRFLHLAPIQYISVLLLAIGITLIVNCINLKMVEEESSGDERRKCNILGKLVKVFEPLTMVLICGVCVVNATLSQLYALQEVRKLWVGCDEDNYWWCNKLQGPKSNVFILYIAATLLVTLSLMLASMIKLLNLKSRMPGVAMWVVCVLQVLLTVFCVYAMFHTNNPSNPVVFKVAPLSVLVMNMLVLTISGLGSVVGMLYHGLDALRALVWLVTLIFLPLASLLSVSFETAVTAINNTQQQQQPQEATADGLEDGGQQPTGGHQPAAGGHEDGVSLVTESETD